MMFAGILAFSLLFGTAGCGSDTTTKGTDTTTAAQSGTTAAQETTAAAKPKVTLTMYGFSSTMKFPAGVQQDPVMKYIEDTLGISIDMDVNYDENKFKAMMAGNDLTDIVCVQAAENIKTLQESKQIIAMDDLLNSNGQEITKNIPGILEFVRKFQSQDTNKVYFLPGGATSGNKLAAPGNMFAYLWNIRWDYYKELGYPQITNYTDDVLKILADMQKKHPKTDDGKKVYGVAFWSDWGTWPIQCPYVYQTGQYGGVTKNGSGDYSSLLDPNHPIWIGADFFYKANKMGILDPDSFTQKWDAVGIKVKEGRVLAFPFSWIAQPFNDAMTAAGRENVGFASLVPPEGTEYSDIAEPSPFGGPWQRWAISSNCKNPDRVMDLFNFMYSYKGSRTFFDGVEGRTWKMENGKPVWIKDAWVKNMKDNTAFQADEGAGKYANMAGLGGDIMTDDGFCVDLGLHKELEPEKLPTSPIKQDMLDHYGMNIADLIVKNIKDYSCDISITKLLPAQSDELKQIQANVDNYLNVEIFKLILSKNDEEFKANREKMFKFITDAGYQKIVDERNAGIAKYRPMLDEIMKK